MKIWMLKKTDKSFGVSKDSSMKWLKIQQTNIHKNLEKASSAARFPG